MAAAPTTSAPPRLPCPQCAAPIDLADDQPFRLCAHCGAALYLDLQHLVLHVHAAPRVGLAAVEGLLQKFLRAAEITTPPRQVRAELYFVPFAVFTGHEVVRSAPLTLFGGRPLRFEAQAFAASFEPYDAASARGQVLPPEASVEEARARAGAADDDRVRLVHVPFYRVRYLAAERRYEAVLSALDGAGQAEVLPPASSAELDRNYALWAGLALFTFCLEALLMPSLSAAMLALAPTVFVFWWFLTGVQGAHR